MSRAFSIESLLVGLAAFTYACSSPEESPSSMEVSPVVAEDEAQAQQAGAGEILPFEATETTLDNGLRVIVVPTGLPNIVSLQIPVQTGSRNEIEVGKTVGGRVEVLKGLSAGQKLKREAEKPVAAPEKAKPEAGPAK